MTNPNPNSEYHISSTGLSMSASDWLDVHFLAMQTEYEEMLRWVDIQPNWHILDAASGSGSFLPLMTELVGSGGKVSAIDMDPENVRAIEARAKQSQWLAPVSARVGTILELPYENETFDAVWCANTTEYLTDDELNRMLREFRRVVRSGGLIAIKDYDVTAQQFQPCPPTLCLHLHEALARAGKTQHHGLLRVVQLANWLRVAGLVDVKQKPTLMLRFSPLRPVEKTLICDILKWFYKQAQSIDLPTEELQIWKQMADVDSPNHIINDPDFQYRTIQTVFLGRVP